jgi:hypothetical protein
MATLAALTNDVLNMLYGVVQVERPTEDTQVTATFTNAATEVELSTPALWKRGDYAEADDGDVIILAEDHPAASSTVTVRRSQRGSTATEHLAASAVWSKNPPFLRTQIERFINETVRSDLWPKVWTWHNGTVTYTDGDSTYDLPQYIEDVVVVYQYDLSSDEKLHPMQRGHWSVERQIDTNVSTNQNLLRLRQPYDSDYTVYYTGKRRPDPSDLANMSDEVAQLIPWAVAAKLMAGVRSAPQRFDPPRRDRDSTEGGTFRDYRGLLTEFIRQRNALNVKLMNEVKPDKSYVPRPRRRRW